MNKVYNTLHAIYQLAIAMWLAAGVMIAISAAAIFATCRSLNVSIADPQFQTPVFTSADSPFVMTDVLAGKIVGNLIQNSTAYIMLPCVLLVILFLLLEATLYRKRLLAATGVWLRLLLLVTAMTLFIYAAGFVQPKAFKLSKSRYQQGISNQIRDERIAQFKKVHRQSTQIMSLQILLLLAVYFTPAHRGLLTSSSKQSPGLFPA